MKTWIAECRSCGKDYVSTSSIVHYCSNECRFWSKVKRGEGCWLWTASVDKWGYGKFGSHRQISKAHRFAWELAYGAIPNGLIIRHIICDNPPCVRVDHMALGTHRDNSNDKVAKGRQSRLRGELSGHSRLTNEDVLFVKRELERGTTHLRIAGELGVSASTIGMIANGTNWAWLKP